VEERPLKFRKPGRDMIALLTGKKTTGVKMPVPTYLLDAELKGWNMTNEEYDDIMRQCDEAIQIYRRYPYQPQAMQAIRDKERRSLAPKDWNFTRNPGVQRKLRHWIGDVEVPFDALESTRHDEVQWTEWSSDQISEEIDDTHRDFKRDMYRTLQSNKSFSHDPEFDEYLGPRPTPEDLYKKVRDEFLDIESWKEIMRPKYFSPSRQILGQEFRNKTFHYLKLVEQISALTPSNGSIEPFRFRWSDAANDVEHHRFHIPEPEFYRFLLSQGLSVDECAWYGSHIKYSEELDLLEDLHLAGVSMDKLKQIKNTIKRQAEKSVDFYPGIKLPKRFGYKDHAKVLGPRRIAELQDADEGWWFAWRHYLPNTGLQERVIVLQHVIRWRGYECDYYAEWQKRQPPPFQDGIPSQLPYLSREDLEAQDDGFVLLDDPRGGDRELELGDVERLPNEMFKQPKPPQDDEEMWKPSLDEFF